MEGALIRLASVDKDPHRDMRRMLELESFWQQYLQLLEDGKDYTEEVDTYRWLLEEYRVSLFAQQLGTRTKVSAQRLRAAWRAVAG